MTTISDAYIGSTPISGIYRGSVPLWVREPATPGGGGGGSMAANPHSWFAADELTGFTDGDRIETWPDLSENGHDQFRVSTTASTWPEYKVNQLNGLPGAVFAGNQRLRTAVAFTEITGPVTFVTVVKPGASTAGYYVGGVLGGNMRLGLRVSSNVWQMFRGSFVSGVSASQVDSRVSNIFDEANSYMDANGVSTAVANPGTFSFSQNLLGEFGNGSGYFTGTIYEVLMYDRRLTPEELAGTESYLENKWGLGPFGE